MQPSAACNCIVYEQFIIYCIFLWFVIVFEKMLQKINKWNEKLRLFWLHIVLYVDTFISEELMLFMAAYVVVH